MFVEELGYRTAKCKLCGKPIVWAVNTAGGRIPLDPVAPVFVLTQTASPHCSQAKPVDMDKLAPEGDTKFGCAVHLVSHFSTCVAKTRAWKLLEEIRREGRETEELSAELAHRIDDYLNGSGAKT